MRQADTIRAARALLEDETPLRRDCGVLCGHACCKPDAEGQGGMLLFPGEEALYDPCPGWASLADSPALAGGLSLRFLTCNGRCPRPDRPLACRIFPLVPHATDQGVAVRLDVRAWPMCPLMPSGMAGLSRSFVAAAQAAAALLYEDAECRAYIQWLTGLLEAYREL